MMKSIAATLFAGICAFAFVLPAAAEPVGGAPGDIGPSPAPWLTDAVDRSSKITKPFVARAATAEVQVVELPFEPVVERRPSFLEEAFEAFRRARTAAQSAVAGDPRAMAKLGAEGFALNDVLAVTEAEDGSVTVFVGAA